MTDTNERNLMDPDEGIYNFDTTQLMPMFTIDQQLRMTALDTAAGFCGSVTSVVQTAQAFYAFLAAEPK